MSSQEHNSEFGLSPEIKANQRIYYEYFDEDFAKALSVHVAQFLTDNYFRSSEEGFENLPKRNNPNRPLIYISNHSGMAFPWDGIIMSSRFLQVADGKFKNGIRPLAAPLLSQSALMNPYLVENLWKRVGALDATFLNFETMLHYNDSNLMLYPEGIAGIGKGYNHKYELQRFSSSFVYNSIKYKTDVMSVLTVNGENINPYSYSIPWINKLSNMVGIPFVPIGLLTPFLLIQPWLFYFSFPAKLVFVMGKRYKPYEMTNKSVDELSRDELKNMAEEIRLDMQKDLDAAVETHGREPYSYREHFSVLLKNWRLFPYTVPHAWPFLMSEFERAWKNHTETGEEMKLDLSWGSTIRIFLRDPFIISFYLPILGWIPILLKGLWRNTVGSKS
ncbi:hypothetical protein N8482_02505 [Chitinophagales bacterium]|nr:hypothetical protein [Chitinophagales bacterium]